MAVSDIYELRFNSRFIGQGLVNVFFYRCAASAYVGNLAQALVLAHRALFVPSGGGGVFANVAFSNDWEVMSYECRNLFLPAEIGGLLLGGEFPGTQTGTNGAPNWAYRFRTDRPVGHIRRGQKFFGGVPNGISIDGVLVPTVQDALDDLQTALAADLTAGTGLETAVFEPVIVKRILMPPDEDHANEWYRLPANLSEAQFFVPGAWDLDLQIKTMNSRKIGRGV